MKVLAHVLPMDRHLFYPHTIKGFCVGFAMEHYRCFKIFISSAGRVCINDTVRWFPHGRLKLPTKSKHELLHSAIDDLCTTLQLSMKSNNPPPEGTTS